MHSRSQDIVDALVAGLASGMDSNHVPADVRWAIANWPDDAQRGEVTGSATGIASADLCSIRSGDGPPSWGR